MKKPLRLRAIFVALAGTTALTAAGAIQMYKHSAAQRPVALLATGTNGGADVYAETSAMIDRLQEAGYRVVVVPPRDAPALQNSVNRDLRPLRAAVLQAAHDKQLQVIEPQAWHSDGFHIAPAAAVSIGRRYPGAPTFGDSNSVAINAGTGGDCFGVGGMTTTEILAHQRPQPHTGARQPCRDISAFR